MHWEKSFKVSVTVSWLRHLMGNLCCRLRGKHKAQELEVTVAELSEQLAALQPMAEQKHALQERGTALQVASLPATRRRRLRPVACTMLRVDIATFIYVSSRPICCCAGDDHASTSELEASHPTELCSMQCHATCQLHTGC